MEPLLTQPIKNVPSSVITEGPLCYELKQRVIVTDFHPQQTGLYLLRGGLV